MTFYDQVCAPGQSYNASGLVFKKRGHIRGHVRVLWGQHARDRWALVTNDPRLTGWEYAQRMWIEEAFRDLKSHGWQLEACALTDPQRVARLWIILVVAYAWMLLLGQAVVAAGHAVYLKRQADGTYRRRWELLSDGLACLSGYQPAPLNLLSPPQPLHGEGELSAAGVWFRFNGVRSFWTKLPFFVLLFKRYTCPQ